MVAGEAVSGQCAAREPSDVYPRKCPCRPGTGDVRQRRRWLVLVDPRARLFAIARDYVRHGVENPALYRLMFGGYLTGPDDHRPAIEIAAAEKTKALLADAIAHGGLGRPLPKTAGNERKIAAAILIFWSLMHGLTLLLVDRLVGPSRKTDELSESVLQGMLDGLATRIPVLSPGTWVGPRGPAK